MAKDMDCVRRIEQCWDAPQHFRGRHLECRCESAGLCSVIVPNDPTLQWSRYAVQHGWFRALQV